MKQLFKPAAVILLVIASTLTAQAQIKLTPSPTLVDKTLKRDDSSQVIWYMMADTVQREIGTVTSITKWDKANNLFYGIQRVQMKGMSQPWIDSAVADYNDLHPVYHSSYNMQRNMAITYNKQGITGYYKTPTKDASTFSDQQEVKFFDSNLYPYLINLLPLKEGYTASIPIYEYNGIDHKVLNAAIKSCETYSLNRNGKAPVECWKVKVEDEISPGSEATYYVSKSDHKMMLMELNAGPRKMKMVRVE